MNSVKLVTNLVDNFKNELPIKYFKVDNLFPGEARNYGIKKSSGDIIATIDSKTIPNSNWLELSMKKITIDNFDVSFGSTCYLAESSFQKILRGPRRNQPRG